MLKSGRLGFAALLTFSFVLCSFAQAPSNTGNISQIQHIVYIIKENRSFDSFWGTYPGANGATKATRSAHGTTRFISSKNSRLRVRLVVRFRPRSVCFMP